jgi:hypothetical protein
MPSPAPWSEVSFDYPAIPTMISWEERSFLYWLTSEQWTGQGHVVEMGPWLGGSTVCLAMGMRASGRRSSRRLHVFDNFIWRPFMGERAALPLADGESFRSYFEKNLDRFRDLLEVHQESLPDEHVPSDPLATAIRDIDKGATSLVRWERSEPVEILFIDGAKSWTGMVHLLREMGPALLPRESLIVCQDYKYWGTYWVPLALEMLKDSLELVHVLDANTAAFRLVAPLGQAEVDGLPEFSDLDIAEALRLLDRASAKLEEHDDISGACIVKLSKVRLLGNLGQGAEARRVFRQVEQDWPISVSNENLDRARAWLTAFSGVPIPPSRFFRLRTSAQGAFRRSRAKVGRLARRAGLIPG